LEIAVRQLQRGELQAALVGAVDLAADLRAALSADVENAWSREHGARPWSRAASGAIPGEGALALVLMRESEARRRGLPVLGLLRGLGVGSATSLEAQKKVAEQAWREAGCASIDADLIEGTAPGSAQDAEIEAQLLSWFAAQRSFGFCSPGAIAPITGETGAATGLSLLLKALLQLDARVLAPLAGRGRLRRSLASPRLRVLESARPWLRDRIDGPRRAAVHHISPDGATTHLVLEEAADQRPAVSVLPAPPALFLLRGDSEASLSRRIDALDASLQSRGEPLTQLARSFRDGGEGRFGLALWGRNKSELREHLAQIRAQIGRVDQLQRDGLRYSARALAQSGELAFVYPGSGNQRLQMGRSLLLAWPQLERRQDQENERLESQLCSDWLWAESEAPAGWEAKHRELILAQVTLGTLATDWLRLFLPDPKSILGYSLGESAALFGMRLWPARDEMLRRVLATPLFTSQLSGDFEAVKAAWKLAPGERVDWRVGIVPVPATRVREAIASRARVYLLIINTPGECVIGGDAAAVDALLRELGCVLLPLEGITSVHCEVLAPVAEAYENLHRLPTRPQPGIKVYSGARGESYELSEESAARAILEQALYGIDFPKLIESAYAEGSRIFVEVGPGNSCTRMIRRILGDRPACTVAALPPDSDPDDSLCALLASLHAEGLSVRLEALDARAEVLERTPRVLKVSNAWPIAEDQDWSELRQPRQAPEPAARPLAPALAPAPAKSLPRPSQPAPAPLRPATSTALLAPSRHSSARSLAELQAPVEGALRLAEARASAHEAFMSLAQQTEARLAAALSWQMSLYAQAGQEGVTLSSPPVQAAPELASRPAQAHQESADLVRFSARPSQLKNPALRLDFEACLEFARGQVGPVLGPDFAGADAFPTRVRLPDEPLQLVHGIRLIEGEARSMTKGRVVTEHEIRENAWYLDDGHIPTCIAVEAGQADLFLSGYLGIDFETRGLACYRLLDAIVSFHRALPGPGSVIVYDIHIDGFFRQGATWLFRFRFEGTVDGEPLLSMREGCAGFFSEAELAAGKGIIKTRLDLQKRPGKVGPGWRWLAPPIQAPETLSAEGITALQSGDLGAAFGPAFAALPLKNPLRLPGRRFEGDLMRLLDRVTHIDSRGGRFGLGVLEAEFDIHPDDWFLTCHFVDDQVMPGTLMYECCMHALRVWLMRMGWVFEDGEASTEPLPGVSSRLKCRGQVVATTRIAGYEITIKELGLEPMPYVIADALMFADGKPIVEITDMSLRLKGMSAARLEEIWSSAPALPALASKKPAIFGPEKIRAFSLGKPSEAFGAPYKIFDEGRIIARLPGPPYEFLHRITRIEGCEAFVMSAGGDIDAEFDCSPNDWYFAANRGSGMPFAVLLEVALQPCGWLAGYVGSALTSEVDLSFRNLGGKARQLREVNPQGGPLCTRVKMTAASRSGGMIIQHFEMDLRQDGEPVYQGTTYFGFFTKDALSQQVGIRGANIYQPDAAELARSLPPRDYPREAPFPADQLRMLDQVVLQIPDGGPAGLGFLRGTKKVREDDWFFKAHFYQDPVCPGSLGLESFLQLLMLQAAERWSNRILLEKMRFQAMALGQEHEWVYRGQVIPRDKLVTVQAAITAIDDDTLQIEAAGHLSVDGRIIYGMERFAIRVWESPE
jgi:acyl transferase domain-containing protein/3-hydroxymyristoyl/3-hydroxydecanoyl-(acyl carrier protein) dehydratase